MAEKEIADCVKEVKWKSWIALPLSEFSLPAVTGLLLLALAGCNTASPPPTVDLVAEKAKVRDVEATLAKVTAAKDLERAVRESERKKEQEKRRPGSRLSPWS